MNGRKVAAGAGIALTVAGGVVLGVAAAAQQHAPQPVLAQAGSTGPAAPAPSPVPAPSPAPSPVPSAGAGTPAAAIPAHHRQQGRPRIAAARRPALARSLPVSISIPAIGVHSPLLHLGVNPDGTIEVPPLNDPPATNEAAWYKYSATPGQLGPSIIEGHVDSARDGPSVFFRLGALQPGDEADITLADHQVAIFTITGVRLYAKDSFPTATVYGPTGYPALRLITCGGSFDQQTGNYLSNVVAFASLVSSYRG